MQLIKKIIWLLLLLVILNLSYNAKNAYWCTPPEGRSTDPIIRYGSADVVFVWTIKDIYTQDGEHLVRLEVNRLLKWSMPWKDIAIKTSYNSASCWYDTSILKKWNIRLMYGMKSNDGTYRVENTYPNKQFWSIEDANNYIINTFPQRIITGDNRDNSKVCDNIYRPVCGEVAVMCIKAPCYPQLQSFTNICEAEKNWATNITEWVCYTDELINTWDTWLNNPTLLDKIEWAHAEGITSFDTIEWFMPDDFISRQQASKMMVNFAKGLMTEEVFNSVKNYNCKFVDEALFHYSLVWYIQKACEQNIFVWAYSNASGDFFYPYDTLTRWQAITVMMRVLHGKLDENIIPRYKNYLDNIKIVAPDINWDIDFEKHITRWEIVEWMYEVNKYYNIYRY